MRAELFIIVEVILALALRVMQGHRALAGIALFQAVKSSDRPERRWAADGNAEQHIESLARCGLVGAGDDTPLLAVPALDEGVQVQAVGRIFLTNCPDIARADGSYSKKPVIERAGIGCGNHAPCLPVPVDGERLQERADRR